MRPTPAIPPPCYHSCFQTWLEIVSMSVLPGRGAGQKHFSKLHRNLSKYNSTKKSPKSVISHIRARFKGRIPAIPKPGNPLFQNPPPLINGRNIHVLTAGRKKAERLGYHSLILSSMIEVDKRNVAGMDAANVKAIIKFKVILS
jgi:glycerate-2-kinase